MACAKSDAAQISFRICEGWSGFLHSANVSVEPFETYTARESKCPIARMHRLIFAYATCWHCGFSNVWANKLIWSRLLVSLLAKRSESFSAYYNIEGWSFCINIRVAALMEIPSANKQKVHICIKWSKLRCRFLDFVMSKWLFTWFCL